MIDSTGSIAWEYHKAHPLYGGESSFISAGGGSVKGHDASFGRIGAVICHDLDFPPLLRQASSERLDLVIGPSDDGDDVAPLHARMAVFRAIENGVPLFRPTRGGRTMAVDPYGRITARVDLPEDAMVANIGIGRIGTVYGIVGDLFSWLCVVALFVCVVLSSRRARRSTFGE
jgi:apolipoprotein N-acyltransferase